MNKRITVFAGANRDSPLQVIITFFLLLLTSCSVGPDYVRPPVAVPESYKEMKDWKVAQPRDHTLRGAWWEIFNDPLLNALEAQVDISNQNVIAAEAQFRQARALVQVARASYFPTASIDPSYTRSRRGIGTGGGTSGGTAATSSGTSTSRTGATTGASGISSTFSSYSLPADVTWDLDVWGKVRRSVEASSADAQASAADLESARLSAQTDLAQDYFQLRSLDEQKRVMDEAVAYYGKSLELTKNRYATGVASRADVLQAETQLKTARAQAIDIGVQRSQLEHAIALLIGKPASEVSIPASRTIIAPPAIPAGLPSELLERRPDIAAAERRVASANARIGVAEAAFFPTITLTASGGFTGQTLSQWLTWPNRFWSIGSTLSEALFEGGLRRAQTEQARAAYDANVALYRQAVLTGFQDVENNLAALRILEEEACAQDEAVKASEQALLYTANQYKAGIVSYLNVVVAQNAVLTNKRTAADLYGRRMTASVLLVKALGGGWEATPYGTNGLSAARPPIRSSLR